MKVPGKVHDSCVRGLPVSVRILTHMESLFEDLIAGDGASTSNALFLLSLLSAYFKKYRYLIHADLKIPSDLSEIGGAGWNHEQSQFGYYCCTSRNDSDGYAEWRGWRINAQMLRLRWQVDHDSQGFMTTRRTNLVSRTLPGCIKWLFRSLLARFRVVTVKVGSTLDFKAYFIPVLGSFLSENPPRLLHVHPVLDLFVSSEGQTSYRARFLGQSWLYLSMLCIPCPII